MEIIMDAVLDSIKILPFLFLVYLLIEYLEHNTDNVLYRKLIGVKWIGPIIGALLGCLPQCGFSVVGANLYSKRLISVGTLLAIFLSTSDEAIPILFANPSMLHMVIVVLVIKLVIAITMGLLIDGFMRITGKQSYLNSVDTNIENQHENEEIVVNGCHDACCSVKGHVWKSALRHTIKVFLYILVITLVLNGIIYMIGEESLGRILLSDSIWQPALAGLIGLIPNCAASIILTEMYIAGSIGLGSMIAGLSTGAGIGLVILFKANKNVVENIKIIGMLYVIGTAFGMLIETII